MTRGYPENVKLSAAGEFGLIERLTKIASGTLAQGVRGAGDDCAAVPLGDSFLVVTTDVMVEERHFRWELTSAFDLGWKLLAVNLSDLAAAGASPLAAVVTLQLRGEMETAIIEEIYRGIAALAKKSGVSIVGGDTTSSAVVALGITAFGLAAKPLGRAGAKPGDDLWLSGELGGGGLGLALAAGELTAADFSDGGNVVREKYCRPSPRTALGLLLGGHRLAGAAIDVSDGLIQDAGHLARRSGVTLEIDLTQLPLCVTSSGKWNALRAATAGDDYELLFTAAPAERAALAALSSAEAEIPPLRRIGSVLPAGESSEIILVSESGTRAPAVEVLVAAGMTSGGFDHFRRRG